MHHINLADLVRAARVPNAAAIKRQALIDVSVGKIMDHMHAQRSNLTPRQIADALGWNIDVLRPRLRILKDQRRLMSFTVGRKSYWALTSAELKWQKMRNKG